MSHPATRPITEQRSDGADSQSELRAAAVAASDKTQRHCSSPQLEAARL